MMISWFETPHVTRHRFGGSVIDEETACEGKRAYYSRADARAALKRMKGLGQGSTWTGRNRMGVYRCPFSHEPLLHFHIGHRPSHLDVP